MDKAHRVTFGHFFCSHQKWQKVTLCALSAFSFLTFFFVFFHYPKSDTLRMRGWVSQAFFFFTLGEPSFHRLVFFFSQVGYCLLHARCFPNIPGVTSQTQTRLTAQPSLKARQIPSNGTSDGCPPTPPPPPQPGRPPQSPQPGRPPLSRSRVGRPRYRNPPPLCPLPSPRRASRGAHGMSPVQNIHPLYLCKTHVAELTIVHDKT